VRYAGLKHVLPISPEISLSRNAFRLNSHNIGLRLSLSRHNKAWSVRAGRQILVQEPGEQVV